MGKRLEGFKGGRHPIGTIKHEKRFTTSTRCKFCMNKINKKRQDKIKKPLW